MQYPTPPQPTPNQNQDKPIPPIISTIIICEKTAAGKSKYLHVFTRLSQETRMICVGIEHSQYFTKQECNAIVVVSKAVAMLNRKDIAHTKK